MPIDDLSGTFNLMAQDNASAPSIFVGFDLLQASERLARRNRKMLSEVVGKSGIA